MNAYEYLASVKVNVELILYKNDKAIMHYGVRLRPWKQETRVGAMILEQGIDIDDAMRRAARAHYEQRWEKLDYAARPWNLYTPGAVTADDPQHFDFLGPRPTEKDVSPIPLSGRTKKDENAS